MKSKVLSIIISFVGIATLSSFFQPMHTFESTISQSELDIFVGSYEMDEPFEFIEVTNENDKLCMDETNLPKICVMQQSELIFVGNGATFTFQKDEEGNIVGLDVLVKGDLLKGKRLAKD